MIKPAVDSMLSECRVGLVERCSYGKLRWDLVRFFFHHSPHLRNGKIDGEELRAELAGELVADEGCLEYLRHNPKKTHQLWKMLGNGSNGSADSGALRSEVAGPLSELELEFSPERRLLFFGTVFLATEGMASFPSIWTLSEESRNIESAGTGNLFFQHEPALLFRPTVRGFIAQPFRWTAIYLMWCLRKRGWSALR